MLQLQVIFGSDLHYNSNFAAAAAEAKVPVAVNEIHVDIVLELAKLYIQHLLIRYTFKKSFVNFLIRPLQMH